MFRITQDPSSGSLVQCLAKNYRNDSVVSVDMDVIGVVAAYCDMLCACVLHCIGSHSYSVNYTRALWAEYAAITPTMPTSTDTIEPFL